MDVASGLGPMLLAVLNVPPSWQRISTLLREVGPENGKCMKLIYDWVQ
jgi:hypothetical protein